MGFFDQAGMGMKGDAISRRLMGDEVSAERSAVATGCGMALGAGVAAVTGTVAAPALMLVSAGSWIVALACSLFD